MTQLHTLLAHVPSPDRLARILGGMRVIGGLGFVLLGIYFVIQDACLEATLTIVITLAWVAATTEAMNLLLERYWLVAPDYAVRERQTVCK
jgi:hypothetical protein